MADKDKDKSENEARDDEAQTVAAPNEDVDPNLRGTQQQPVTEGGTPVVPSQEGTVGQQPLDTGGVTFSTDPEEDAELRAEHDAAVRRAAVGERADEDVERDEKETREVQRERRQARDDK